MRIENNEILSEIRAFGSFRALNATLSKENKMKLVSVEDFKELNKDSKNNTNWMVCHIEDIEVKQLEDKNLEFILYLTNREECHVTTDGQGWFVKINGSKRYFDTNKSKGRIVTQTGLTLSNSVISIERIIAIACSYILDEMPSTFEGIDLQANVIDLSGNAITAHQIGIKAWNFFPHNIEWTTKNRNSYHCTVMLSMIKKLKIFGFVPEFSANTIYEVADYMNTHSATDVAIKYSINCELKDADELDF